MAGKGFMKICQRKVNKWNIPWYGPHRAHNQLKWWLRYSSTTKPYSDTQSFTFPPELHDGPRPLVQIANGLGKSSQQKQTTQDFFILAAKFDSVLVCLCVCDKKLNFLSWAIRSVFADPVTFVLYLLTYYLLTYFLTLHVALKLWVLWYVLCAAYCAVDINNNIIVVVSLEHMYVNHICTCIWLMYD